VAITDDLIDNANIDQIRKLGGQTFIGVPKALIQIVERDDVDVVLAAVVGAAGLRRFWRRFERGKGIGPGNKESLDRGPVLCCFPKHATAELKFSR